MYSPGDSQNPVYRELASLLIVSGASDIGEVYAHKTLFEKFVVQNTSGCEAEPARLCHTTFLIRPRIEARANGRCEVKKRDRGP